MFIILHSLLLFPRLILGKFPHFPVLLVAMAPVVTKTRGTTINRKAISNKGAATVTLINISNNLQAGAFL